jgi:phage gp45-like
MFDFEHDDGLRSAIRRVIFKKVDDSGTQQKTKLTGLKKEELDEIVRIQSFGHHSVPPDDAEGIIMQMGARSDRTVVMGGEHKDHKPKNWKPGESGIYDAFKKFLRFGKDKTEWEAGDKPLEITKALTIKMNATNDYAIGAGSLWIRIRPSRVDLGVDSPTGEAEHGVETSGGTSTIVFARV